jgi:hypothetical protein
MERFDILSRRPDPESRDKLADGVNNLLRKAFRFLGARVGFFEPGIKLPQSLLGSPRFAAATGRHLFGSTTLSLLRGCHLQILAEDKKHRKITDAPKGKGYQHFCW